MQLGTDTLSSREMGMRALKVGNWAKHPSVHHSVTYLHQPVVHETTSVQLELDSGTREEEGTTCSIQSTDDGPWGPLGQQGDVQAAFRDNDARSLRASTKPRWRPRITPDSSSRGTHPDKCHQHFYKITCQSRYHQTQL